MQASSKGPRQNKEAGVSEYYLGQCVACVECTRTVGVWWNIGAEATKTNLMVIKAHGKHGKPKEKDGSMLWSAEEMAVVNELLQSSEPASSRGLKKAFREKGIQTKCENKQINNCVKRTRSNVKALTPHGGTGSPIEVLRMHIDQHVAEQGSGQMHHYLEYLYWHMFAHQSSHRSESTYRSQAKEWLISSSLPSSIT